MSYVTRLLMLKLPKREKKALSDYQNAVLSVAPEGIKRIILFGSKARGHFNRDSDTDVLIVVHKKSKSLRKIIVGLTFYPVVKYSVDISPIIMDEREFSRWSPFIEHVKKDGIELWNRKKKRSLLS